ncbi:neocarzinostatin apoprotein domain-containing protein [Promicromonospora sukumoe]|uniref:neocarzinostatin apoprotein domain-containing protein n=1 Tax=Promicromonospora sukumoe TaxID=88382 RepID=UPI00039B9731|nr:neocarzinostatin apoprotein domain-containing protein [Promicromonospora sukumoe]
MRARLIGPVAVATALLLLAGCTAGPTGQESSGSARGSGASPSPGQESRGADGTSRAHGGAGGAGGADGAEEPTLTVRSAGGAWIVRGTGFAGRNQYLVQCTAGTTPGASALDECDMSTSEQVVADDDGRISETRQARAFVNVGAVSEVDCTGDPCTLAVADLSDRVLVSAPAPLPGGSEPPDAPVLELSEPSLKADAGRVTVTGAGFAAGSTVRIVQCATTPDGGVDGDNCLYDDGRRVIADRAGTLVTRLRVEREIKLVGGGVADCAEQGACVVANAWTDGGRIALADLLWE